MKRNLLLLVALLLVSCFIPTLAYADENPRTFALPVTPPEVSDVVDDTLSTAIGEVFNDQ